MSGITTHVLDVARGVPAAGIRVTVGRSGREADGSASLAEAFTDTDGRVRQELPWPLERGVYRITFDTAAYFRAQNVVGFYPEITITFEVSDPAQHYHVPLLLSPFGYSTYRGS